MKNSLLTLGKVLNPQQLRQINGGVDLNRLDSTDDGHYSCGGGHHHEYHTGGWVCVQD